MWKEDFYWEENIIKDEMREMENANDWNDRVMSLSVDENRMFFIVSDYAKWYKNNDIEIVDEFYGGLY